MRIEVAKGCVEDLSEENIQKELQNQSQVIVAAGITIHHLQQRLIQLSEQNNRQNLTIQSLESQVDILNRALQFI